MMLHLQISDNLMKKVREVGQDQVQEKNWSNTKSKKGWSIVAIVGIISKCICLA
jgi:hypothetical protein